MNVRWVIFAVVLAALGTGAGPAAAEPHVAFTSLLGGALGMPACGDERSDTFAQAGADPRDPRRLRALYLAGGLRLPVAAASEDGGRTWSRQPLTGATACAGGPAERALSVNPRVAVGRGGALWFGQSWIGGFPPGTFRYGVAGHRWAGRGAWAAAASSPSDDDAQNTAILPHVRDRRRASMLWTDFDQVDNPMGQYVPTGSRLLLAHTTDAGRTWSAPRVVHRPPDARTLLVNVRLERASNGDWLAFFDSGQLTDLPGAQLGLHATVLTLHAMRSADGGATWSEPRVIGTPELVFVDDPDHDALAPNTPAVSSKYDVATGPGGLVAAVWRETGRSTVRLALSGDDGRTWSAPRDTVGVSGELMQPAVAIDGAGRLAILWYDWARDVAKDAAGWQTDVRAAISPDRGATWATLRLTDHPFDLHRTNACRSATSLPDPFTRTCELDFDATGVGAYPDLVPLGKSGFGAIYTVGPPLARDGFTDALFTRLRG